MSCSLANHNVEIQYNEVSVIVEIVHVLAIIGLRSYLKWHEKAISQADGHSSSDKVLLPLYIKAI